MVGLAQKTGVIGRQGIDHGKQGRAGPVRDHVLVVILEGVEAAVAHEAPQARAHQFFLALFEIEREGAVGQLADLLELARGERLHSVGLSDLSAVIHCSFP